MRVATVRRRKKHKHKIPSDQRDWLRWQLTQKYGENATCYWCGVSLLQGDKDYQSDQYATIEHIVRIADGGTDDMENLTWACAKCNNTRHTS